MKSGPHLPQLEKALAQKQRPNTAINQSINQIFKKMLNYLKKKMSQVNRNKKLLGEKRVKGSVEREE